MATLLRPPLRHSPLQKRPIAPVDYFSRPLTLGITTATPKVAQLCESAPQIKRSYSGQPLHRPYTLTVPAPDTTNQPAFNTFDGVPQKLGRTSVDVYPNLLRNTLGTAAPLALPLNAIRWDVSAPPLKKAVTFDFDDLVNPVVKNPVPQILRLESREQKKYQLQIEFYQNLLSTTLKPTTASLDPPLSFQQWDDTAPQGKEPVYADVFSNPVVLQPVPLIQKLDAREQRKYSVWSLDFPNLSGSTLAPPVTTVPLPLSAVRLDQSAPSVKFRNQVDLPTVRSIVLNPVPRMLTLDASAPWVKYQPQVDITSNTVLRGINRNANVLALTDSAPPPKFAVQVDRYPNLMCTTLYVPPSQADSQQTVTVRMSFSTTVFGPTTTKVNG